MLHILEGLFFASVLVLSVSTIPFTFAQNDISYSFPLKQFKNGVSPYDVKCLYGFTLIINVWNSSPACVKGQTAQKLVERGWGVSKDQLVWFEFVPIQCQATWDEYWHKNSIIANTTLAYTESMVIHYYFKNNGINLLDARESIMPNGKPCGMLSDVTFYFLVLKSDSDKMANLGYKLITTPLKQDYIVRIR